MICKRCVGLVVVTVIGTCSRCLRATSSSAHKLCNSCSEEQCRCKACGVYISDCGAHKEDSK